MLTKELSDTGQIPVISANVKEPFGYIDKEILTDYSVDSVLWGIDGDWMTACYPKNRPFYPTDHCGVLRVLTDEVNPRYLAWLLEKEGRKRRFSRSYRASIDRIEGIVVSVPAKSKQDKVVNQVSELENKIRECEQRLRAIENKKMAILDELIYS